jgi:hypothetical protein
MVPKKTKKTGKKVGKKVGKKSEYATMVLDEGMFNVLALLFKLGFENPASMIYLSMTAKPDDVQALHMEFKKCAEALEKYERKNT